MNARFLERNIGAFTQSEQNALFQKKVCVVGCGGLGGYAVEMLARAGVGELTVIDGDSFCENNLNRQLYARADNLGASKAIETAKRCRQVAPFARVTPRKLFITQANAVEQIRGHDIVIDALDNAKTRLTLENACEELNIVLVHAAVSEWNAQICVVFPGDRTLRELYGGDHDFPTPSVPSFTPAFAAALQVSQAVKCLIGRGAVLRKQVLLVDLLSNTYDILRL